MQRPSSLSLLRARALRCLAPVALGLVAQAGAARSAASFGLDGQAPGEPAPSVRVPGAQESSREELEALRRRWAGKSDEERAELRDRFRKLQELSAEDRELFLSLGRRVEEARRRWRSKGGGGDFRTELERRRERLREHLHPPLLETLRRHPREQRPVLLERELRKLHREGRLLERFGERMGLSAGEIDALRQLPADERKERLAGLRRAYWTQRLKGMEGAADIEGLSDDELLERLREARRRRLERARGRTERSPRKR